MNAAIAPALDDLADVEALARSVAAFAVLLHHYTRESSFVIRVGDTTVELEAGVETRMGDLLSAARAAAPQASDRAWELGWVEAAGDAVDGAMLALSVRGPTGMLDGDATCRAHRGLLALRSAEPAIASHYSAALAAMATPDAMVGHVSLLSSNERTLLTHRMSHTALAPALAEPRLLHRLFEAQVGRRPDHPAVEQGGRTVTYRELDEQAARIAEELRARGIGRGHFVALQLPRSPDVYAAILGILKAGAAYVPLDPEYPADRVDYILRDCKASLLLTTSALCPDPTARAAPVLFLDGDWPSAISRGSAAPAQVTPDDVCYVIYTSGSTGKPKGVALEHRSVAHLVLVEQALYGVTQDDRVFQGFSVAFDAAVEEVWAAFAAGATLVVGTKADMLGDLAGCLTRSGITFFSTVPTLLASVNEDLPTVRILILGGEACPQALVERWATPGRRLFNTYGPTEATVIATWAELRPGDKVTIGRPITNYFTYVVNPAGGLAPAGVPGELCIGGPGVARGYVGMPALTGARFVPNPFDDTPHAPARLYRTGDRVRYDDIGNLEFLGRLDDQVKLRGFRIELGEIENALMAIGGLSQVVAMVRKDTPTGEQLVAYVVAAAGSRPTEERLKEALRAHLPPYMVPAYVEVMDALPTLTSGKVDRKALPRPAARADAARGRTDDVPRTSAERAVAACFASLLGLPHIGRDDDFFDLGGHSMLVAQAVSQLRREPGLATTSVVDVYNAPTVAKLASRLAARTAEPARVDTPLTRPEPVSSLGYVLCGAAQLLLLYFVFGLYGLQWEGPYLAYGWLRHQDVTQPVSLLLTALALVLIYPATLLVAVAAKWLVVGRYRPGRHKLWGWYYLRWWVMDRLLGIIPVGLLAGTPLLNWYYRLLGARIGKNVLITSASLGSFDLIDIGDDTTLDLGADLSGDTVENGALVLGPIRVGKRCHIGVRAVLADGSSMDDDSSLGRLSALPRGATVPRGQHWEGCPARRAGARNLAQAGERPAGWRRAAFTVAAAAGAFLLPLLVLLAISPGMLALNHLYRVEGGHARYLIIAPLVALSFIVLFCLEVALLKWLLLGRIRAGSYQVYSADYFRKWLFDQAMEASLDLIGSLYATSFLKVWYRILGVRLGPNCEVSTATGFAPDLLEIGEGAFIADCVSLGAPHTDGNRVHLETTKVGRRTFIGNSGVVLGGTTVGEECLLGCLSACPTDRGRSDRPGSVWLGSPAMNLPTRQASVAFPDDVTYNPSAAVLFQRYAVELFRVVLPTTGFVVNTCLLITTLIQLSHWFPPLVVALLFPLLYAGFGACAGLVVIAAKWLLVGRFRPAEKPLFDPFVWRAELVNALHEYLVNPCFIELLEGTPFAAWFFRGLGMRIGKRVYLATTEFTEYDLLEIGDGACLNNDCTLQTHLFEDRVMKMSRVHVGAGCTVGRDAIVLYDATMEDGSSLGSLSLLMKGETLPADSHWEGCPAMAVAP